MKVIETTGAPIKAWIEGVPVEEAAIEQAKKIAGLPFIHKHVAMMPDAHSGIGSTVGTVIATKGAVVPAACGVDLGCGMIARRLTLTASDLPDNLFAIRSAIEAAIPHGRTGGGLDDKGSFQDPESHIDDWLAVATNASTKGLFERHPKAWPHKHPSLQLGTLGSGNHFIEVCLDETDRVWLMLHSGSRGFGNRIGSYFIELAKEDMRKWFVNLPDQDLAYLPEGTDHFDDYVAAVSYAQEYARMNREVMMHAAIEAIRSSGSLRNFTTDMRDDGSAADCHHNYLEREFHFGANVLVTRKGAVRAREGDIAIIPGSMGAKSFIVRGKGNTQSFHSCSHGAGRAMSRTKAREMFTVQDHVAATYGVECRKDVGVIDETPGAYKSIDAVMDAQRDLVDVVHTLKAVLCVKG